MGKERKKEEDEEEKVQGEAEGEEGEGGGQLRQKWAMSGSVGKRTRGWKDAAIIGSFYSRAGCVHRAGEGDGFGGEGD